MEGIGDRSTSIEVGWGDVVSRTGAEARWGDSARELLLRLAASGLVSARRFVPIRPEPSSLAARGAPLHLEIVSHCWQYSHLLVYQLSSLVNYPPSRLSVRMTVFYSSEDPQTASLLAYFAGIEVPGVTWNWQILERTQLMRRAIGRNLAALATAADWVWFTDCDVVFHERCLDTLAEQLEARRSVLVYPREERCTSLLSEADPVLAAVEAGPRVVDIDPSRFSVRKRSRATGPIQITHGDVARSLGYCGCLSVYQKPRERWCKCREDRAYRWLLGTQGEPIDVPGVYRIRHVEKGRYGTPLGTRVRGGIRQMGSWLRERWAETRPPGRS